jgi:hypothetical protein
MKVTFTILSQPDGRWHWVMRLWEHGPEKLCTVYSVKETHSSAIDAFGEAGLEYMRRSKATIRDAVPNAEE